MLNDALNLQSYEHLSMVSLIGQECIDPFGNLIKLISQVKLIRFNYM